MAFDMNGKALVSRCTGTIKATVDGVMTDFSKNLLCWYRSDGTKSLYFIQAADTTRYKSFNINIQQEGGKYSVPGTAGAPGFAYIDGNAPFAFPKNAESIPLEVTNFAPAGAGLKVTFSPGEVFSQPGGKGAGPKVITDGSIDIAISL